MNLKFIGLFLIAIGIGIILYSFSMPVSQPYAKVVNIHLLHMKQNTLTIGGLIFIAGVIFLAVFKLKETKEDAISSSKSKDEALRKFASNSGKKLQLVEIYVDQFLAGRYRDIKPFSNHPIARICTGLYVGLCLAGLLALILNLGYFAFIFFTVLALSFLPWAASPVIMRLNEINVLIIILALLFSETINGWNLLLLTPISLLLWLYARIRLR